MPLVFLAVYVLQVASPAYMYSKSLSCWEITASKPVKEVATLITLHVLRPSVL
jgi:hypothetical protein